MALLFLGAKDHRITARELHDLEREYARLNIETSRSVLEFYQSRKNIDKNADAADAAAMRPAVRAAS
jgi:DNA phosphorothioation-dependent restriction protein DptG